ncbi:hypothetical protein KTE49_08265 [Burkholderia multivorans]|uniref:hypothetical protein n=1 Tax=Burkholderia multivorans TaxID=87883 RepID=UPI0011B28895|nr:hypothetical protein [Burkholderia multivorans]MBJ9615558.1 hypothetical protein [Burkholderia multivorans]MBU9328894.1 hypothetical protein [Burkholderia multivorans]MBU9530437.1 hypothetical protein [Burkholderia multivorans]
MIDNLVTFFQPATPDNEKQVNNHLDTSYKGNRDNFRIENENHPTRLDFCSMPGRNVPLTASPLIQAEHRITKSSPRLIHRSNESPTITPVVAHSKTSRDAHVPRHSGIRTKTRHPLTPEVHAPLS